MNILSGILFFAAFIPYIFAILHGETVPSPVSWAIWASVDTLALLAMIKERSAIGQLSGAVVGAWTITILALVYGKPTMGSIEWVCIAGAVSVIVFWQVTGATAAIICSQITVLIGAIPTVIGAYANPAQEDPVAWSIWFISCIFALLAVKKWDIANALQPITFTVLETAMVVLIVVRPLWM